MEPRPRRPLRGTALGSGNYGEEGEAVLKTNNHNPTRATLLARLSRRRKPNDPEAFSRELRGWIQVLMALAEIVRRWLHGS